MGPNTRGQLHGIPNTGTTEIINIVVQACSEHAENGTHFLVHSLAVASYRARSVLYKCAMSGTNGSSGLGSVNIEQIDSNTVRRKNVTTMTDAE